MSANVFLLISLLASGAPRPPVDFDTEIMPILTKAGCNTGACHGAAAGRGGLHLSLYGSDPAADILAITQEWEGRRINLSHPERSLVFRKPTADLDHGGDQRFAYNSESAELILRWIGEGADRHQQRFLTGVEVSNNDYLVHRAGEHLSLQVAATFDDGSRADVTPWVVLTPEDPAALQVTDDGDVEVLRHGRHLLLVRYLDRILPVHVTLPYADTSGQRQPAPQHNAIDRFINDRLQTLGVPPSDQADDATFLRRITLDLTGRLPTPAEVRSFSADESSDKRSRAIDALLTTDEFVDYWTFQFAKLLRVRPIGNDMQAAETFYAWVRDELAKGTGYDRMARELLTSAGDSHEIGPATFHRVVAGPREEAEFVSELFMGVRLRCANCHDHPLDRWTQDDYHGLAAIFARLQRGRIVEDGERGEVSHPKTQEAARPRLPGDRFLSADGHHRADLADWLTSADNPYFARAIVNRIWRQLMGRGLVEPVDDLRATNPGSHPELLTWLAADFADHGYDLRHAIGLVAQSAAYQRSSHASAQNAVDDRYYSHYLAEPLEPEVLADAVADVTGVGFVYGDRPAGTRAIDLIDPQTPAPALDVLGRCRRDESCESAPGGGGIAVKLHLLNGAFLNESLSRETGRLSQLLQTSDDRRLVEEFYLCAFSRLPSDDEVIFWREQFDAARDERRAVAQDFLWSLLTSHEFTSNH